MGIITFLLICDARGDVSVSAAISPCCSPMSAVPSILIADTRTYLNVSAKNFCRNSLADSSSRCRSVLVAQRVFVAVVLALFALDSKTVYEDDEAHYIMRIECCCFIALVTPRSLRLCAKHELLDWRFAFGIVTLP